ncbi:DUF4266 domain-containing protein [Chryseobacterium terrae]|uniref:DUF4266 domain-containing protein n=1 Tax=Chryseobacterium terrae TaxID=3163299 RepID=UPI0038B66A32
MKNIKSMGQNLFGQLYPSSTPAFLLVPHKKSSVQAGLQRSNVLINKIRIMFLFISLVTFLHSCNTVKEYEKNKLNDAEMTLGNRTVEKTELSFQSYREGSSGANAGKVGGGCGCN